ncbi:MAG: Daunorubicin/doxorubicin resistance ATP-binding protein DrrA [Gemmatimonadaceae bacterium]|nr:Daunorubicin/doxorubicin resistance ATP-binding protein DrrA [Gemmatimonadaceae bacterium]
MSASGVLALEVRGLRKTFGDVVAVASLDLQVKTGECFGLLGPNGAGKTTTIEVCEGLLQPDVGEVLVLGKRWHDAEHELRQRLGVQLQETQFSEKITVLEMITLFRSFYEQGPSPDEVIALVQLEEKRRARVGGLSGGQKQRLSIACALAGDPELLFLDEPTTGLDPQSRRQLWELVERLRGLGRTIVLTTHYMDEAERLCDRIAIVDHGKTIALGTPRALVRSLGAEQMVELTMRDGSVGALDATTLSGLPGVLGVRMDGPVVALQVTAAHEALPALLAAVDGAGATVLELRTHTPTLEDVFVSLTGRHLRDQ